MTSFKPTPLFGGAIVVDIPSNFIDTSAIRQVPDTQEVYLAVNGLTSIITDLTQRVSTDDAATDEDALQYHLRDIVSGSGDETKIWGADKAYLTKMPDTPAYTLFVTQHPTTTQSERQGGAKPQPDFTAIMMVLARLEKEKTDIVITINVPHVPGEYIAEDVDLPAQKLGPLMDQAALMRKKVLETFEVKDYGLFVEE